MIRVSGLQVDFAGRTVLAAPELQIGPGEFALLVGPTGSGKSTLLGALAGLVPEYTGGRLTGKIEVAGESVIAPEPARAALVMQRPYEGFVQQTVAAEVGFTLEQQGLPAASITDRVASVLAELGLAEMAAADLDTLSDGEAQRVAIAAALVSAPRLLLLDEPTSALDPASADELIGLLQRIRREHGTTIVVSEHRFDRLLPVVDTVIDLSTFGQCRRLSPLEFAGAVAPAPKSVRLVRLAGGSEPIVETTAARAAVAPLRACLAGSELPPAPAAVPPSVLVNRATVARGEAALLRSVTVEFRPGSITAVLGESGAGKSSLLHTVMGDWAPSRGRVEVNGLEPHRLSARQLLGRLALVPQQPGDLFIADTVADECALADRRRRLAAGATAAQLAALGGELPAEQHPRDLSAGQQLRLALAIALSAAPQVLLLDEPTRGLDGRGRDQLAAVLRKLATSGVTVVFATHDIDLAADLSDQLVVMAAGAVVSAGPPSANLHPTLAPYSLVHQLMSPLPFLSIGQVDRCLGADGAG